MDKKIKFSRNIYIIVIGILIFGIVTQVSRSNMMLKYITNNTKLSSAEWEKVQYTITPKYLIANEADVDKHCIIYNSEDELSNSYYENFQEVYSYLKQPYSLVDTSHSTPKYEGCQAIIILTSLEELFTSVDDLEKYIYEGGYVYLTRIDYEGPALAKIYRKLGIVSYRSITDNYNINLNSNVIIGQNGQSFEGDFFYNASLTVELDHDSQLLAKGKTSPILWRYEYGDGATIVYNGNNLDRKINRGLITGSISLLTPDYIYPIFNSKLFYIDDYPAPRDTGYNEKITKDYNRNISSFYKDIWWPNMISAAKKYNIKYTAVAIEDYNTQVAAPYPLYRKDDLTNLIIYGREIIKTGGEIGIHGYNHQPLQFDENLAKEYQYFPWNSYQDMKLAIQEVLSYIGKALPNYDVVSYVPPSNILSQEGRRALVESWDSLRVISSLYEGDEFGHSYVQEFEIAPDGVIEMPRITSGYGDSPDMEWLEASVMTTHGFISHFIHPDDIFDDYRSGDKGWSQLYTDFEMMLNRIDTSYPWLESRTSGDAAIQVATVLNSNITRHYETNSLSVDIDNFYSKIHFILRTEKKIGKLTHCHVEKIDDNTYLVEATSEQFNIELK